MKNTSSIKMEKAHTQTLAKNLSALLKLRHVSESEIAQSLGIPVMTIRRLVSGETEDPRISTLKLIADYFNVSIDSLIEGDNQHSLPFMPKKAPQFIPILDWKTAGQMTSIKNIDLTAWKEWHPVMLGEHSSLSKNAFALESRPSMQPRFPIGTLFIIDPNEAPTDGDIVLIKIEEELSLRELIIDPPRWQLQPVVAGSEVLFHDEKQYQIVGVIMMSMLHSRKEK